VSDSADLPLSDLRILDLSRLLPGPYASLLMADLGARVDKLEEPVLGDYLRHIPPLRDDRGAMFEVLNRNKRSIALDLKSEKGGNAFRRLVLNYDVLVEGFRPGVMERLGLGHQRLAKENPRLIYCSISGYGQTGPDRLRSGHDLNYIARSGVLGHGGPAEGPPAFPGVQIADVAGSLLAVAGILSAVHERGRTGRGRYVDVALADSSLAFLHASLGSQLLLGEDAELLARGRGRLNGGLACYNIYRTADGRYLSVGALEPKFFGALCQRLNRLDLLDRADGSPEGEAQVKNALADIFLQKPLSEWLPQLSDPDLCVEPVLEDQEVLTSPLLKARGLLVQLEEGNGKSATHLRTPLPIGRRPPTPAPALGEHGVEILREAGFSTEEIDQIL
jgi:crotonobetainyl-CoA:carnitine CoA-transferase CaiB-like acyl-CoA transferase